MAFEKKERKKPTFAGLQDMVAKKWDVQPTNVIPLDIALGGGLSKGDMLEISSPSGVGKSTLLLHTSKNLTDLDNTVAYVDVERGVKDVIVDNVGLRQRYIGPGEDLSKIDPKGKFLHFQPVTFEHMETLVEVLVTIPNMYIFVDSVTALLPAKLQEKSIAEVEPGIESRFAAALLKKVKVALRETGTTMFLISQMRTKFDFSGFQSKVTEDSAGGNASKFYPDIRLRMEAGQNLTREENTIGGVKEIIYGNMARIWAVKNRSERSAIKIDIPVIFGRGISNILFLKKVLEDLGHISGGRGGFYTVKVGNEEFKPRGTQDLIDFIKNNRVKIFDWLKTSGQLNITRGELPQAE